MNAIMRIAALLLAAAISSALALACSTNPPSAPSSSPPLDPSKTLGQLTISEKQAFCDWTNQRQGGYGRTIPCDAGGISLETSQDQATCVAELSQHASEPNCSATVGHLANCFEWLLAHWCPPMLSTRPAECTVIQATCYASGAPPIDGGGD